MYEWAVNKIKLARAIATKGVNALEKDIMAEYVRIGGLLTNEYKYMETELKDQVESTVQQEEAVIEAPVEQTPEVAPTEAEPTPEVQPEATVEASPEVAPTENAPEADNSADSVVA